MIGLGGASNVGEAARVLPSEMLVTYNETKDVEYPGRIAQRIGPLLDRPEIWRQPAANVAIAERYFDYKVLTAKLRQVISDSLRGARGGERQALFPTAPPPEGGSTVSSPGCAGAAAPAGNRKRKTSSLI
jgi:hypothetical protein